jgi:hypothetical protein
VGMKMLLSIAALFAAKFLLPLLLVVRPAARAVASIITYDPISSATPAQAGGPLNRGQKSGVPAFAGMTRSDLEIERGLHKRKGSVPFSSPLFRPFSSFQPDTSGKFPFPWGSSDCVQSGLAKAICHP